MGFFDDGDRGTLGPPPEPFRIGGTAGPPPALFRWIGLAAGLLVLFIVINVGKSLYVDWLWFDSVGTGADDSYLSVFRRILGVRVGLFFAGAVLAAVVIGVNIWLARRLTPSGLEESFIEEVDPLAIRRLVTVGLVAGTLFMAVVFGATAGGSWETLLSWLNAVEFGITEAAFNRDVSFYLFDLPALHFLQGWLLALLVVSLIGAGIVYGLTMSLQRFEINITSGMRIHLSMLVGLVLLTISAGTWLSVFDLATSPGGQVFGATYTDINARLPVRYILVALGVFAGLATIANAFISQGYRLPSFALGVWAFVGVLGGAIYPQFVQNFQVDPNELEKEEQYIARNIALTRFAWGLDQIEETTFPALPAVTLEEVRANPETIDNIRLLDARPLRDTFNQIQSIRPLYLFTDIDIDRYTIQGKTQQVMISARELDINRIADRNWTQERLQLTHGFGAVAAPVNEVTAEGLPSLLTQDIPPVGDDIAISLEGSRIYFGEITNHYVIVNTNEPEFDYPVGEANAETQYGEDRGIRLSSFLRRFALAWELGDTNILISGQIGTGSRLLMDRSLSERITKIAPFLELDRDPYLVVDDGRLIWIQDAYTSAATFPYSQPRAGVNYIRNSVKVTVDALTGDITFYLIDDEPIAATWAKIFPDLFTDIDEMPASLREHLRYPEDLFRLQSDLYLRYHIRDPRVFFVGEDIWAIPTERFRDQEQLVEPYYVVMTLPGEASEEFALVLPFTPRNKQNTVAWLAGRSDGDHYGTLRAFRFPTDDLVFGPAQIEARIDQNPGISQQLTLWDQSGSQVIRGNLLMIPLGESFLFVEPIYLQAENSRLPELKRVVVANGNSIAMEETFQRSLDVVFGLAQSSLPGAGQITIPPPGTPGTEPTAVPPAATATPAPPAAGSLAELLREAGASADSAQADLDRLRQIIAEIERQTSGQ